MSLRCEVRAGPSSEPDSKKSARPTVILADDHEAILAQASQLLEPYFEVIAVVRDGKAAVAAVQQRPPDLVLLDMAMPMLDGIDAVRELHRLGYDGKIAFLTVQDDPMFVKVALDIGASAYILKKSMFTDLVHGIERAIAGETYLSSALRTPPRHPKFDQGNCPRKNN